MELPNDLLVEILSWGDHSILRSYSQLNRLSYDQCNDEDVVYRWAHANMQLSLKDLPGRTVRDKYRFLYKFLETAKNGSIELRFVEFSSSNKYVCPALREHINRAVMIGSPRLLEISLSMMVSRVTEGAIQHSLRDSFLSAIRSNDSAMVEPLLTYYNPDRDDKLSDLIFDSAQINDWEFAKGIARYHRPIDYIVRLIWLSDSPQAKRRLDVFMMCYDNTLTELERYRLDIECAFCVTHSDLHHLKLLSNYVTLTQANLDFASTHSTPEVVSFIRSRLL